MSNEAPILNTISDSELKKDLDVQLEPSEADLAIILETEQAAYNSEIELEPMLQDTKPEERVVIMDYWDKVVTLPLLPPEKTIELLQEYRTILRLIEKNHEGLEDEYGDRLNYIKTTLTAHNSRLILWLVKQNIPQLIKADMTVQDGLQEGSIGMIRAINKFKPELKYQFSTYATWWVRQSIQRSIQNNGMIRHSADVHVDLNQLRHVIRETYDSDAPFDNYNNDTIVKLAATAQQLKYQALKPERIEELLNLKTLTVVSIDKPINSAPNFTIIENIASIDNTERTAMNSIQTKLAGAVLEKILMNLTAKEEKVIRLYYGLVPNRHALTFEEIGTKYGQTRQRIQQIESEARQKIKVIIAQMGIVETSSIMDQNME